MWCAGGGRGRRSPGPGPRGARGCTRQQPARWDAGVACGPVSWRYVRGEPEVDPLPVRLSCSSAFRTGCSNRMHQLTQSSEPLRGLRCTRDEYTRAPAPPPTKDNLPHETHTHTHSARVVWSRVTESSSFANKQHALAHGEHHATRPCSPSVLPRIPPPFDAPPKIDAGLLSSQFSTPVGCVACTGGELWGGDVSV